METTSSISVLDVDRDEGPGRQRKAAHRHPMRAHRVINLDDEARHPTTGVKLSKKTQNAAFTLNRDTGGRLLNDLRAAPFFILINVVTRDLQPCQGVDKTPLPRRRQSPRASLSDTPVR